MQLSLRLLHLPVDGSPVTRELRQPGPDPLSRKITQDEVARQKPRHRSARILIVGDEPAAAEVIRDHLLNRGHTVDLAFSADDALAAIRDIRRDLVLLDISIPQISMPQIDGVAALRRIRAADATLAVIVVTGNADGTLTRETSKLGACGYVVKPIDFAHLDRTIAAALSSRGTKAGEHPDVDKPLCHAPRRGLRAKTVDSGSAGLAQPLHKLVEGGAQ